MHRASSPRRPAALERPPSATTTFPPAAIFANDNSFSPAASGQQMAVLRNQAGLAPWGRRPSTDRGQTNTARVLQPPAASTLPSWEGATWPLPLRDLPFAFLLHLSKAVPPLAVLCAQFDPKYFGASNIADQCSKALTSTKIAHFHKTTH